MGEYEMNLGSPAFAEFRADLNEQIQHCLHELLEGNFFGGEISAKITIDLRSATETFHTGISAAGTPEIKGYNYRKPEIEYKVNLTLKKKQSASGAYSEKMELKRDNQRFIMQAVTSAQMMLSETE